MTARALAFVALLGLAGCDVPFEPVLESDLYFSLSGYLDVSADTQWVRIEPLSPTADPDPEAIDAVATLVDLESGTSVPMTQRVRTFPNGPAHLFWTTEAVRPDATYRLDVRRSDGAETRATVVIPPVEDVEIDILDGETRCPTNIYVGGTDQVADVQTRYTVFRAGGTKYRFTKLESLGYELDGRLRFSAYYGDDAERMGLPGLPLPEDQVLSEITVAIGTEDWPDIVGLDLETALILSPSERIENGVGFVGGTVTTTRTFEPGTITSGFSGRFPCVSNPRTP